MFNWMRSRLSPRPMHSDRKPSHSPRGDSKCSSQLVKRPISSCGAYRAFFDIAYQAGMCQTFSIAPSRCSLRISKNRSWQQQNTRAYRRRPTNARDACLRKFAVRCGRAMVDSVDSKAQPVAAVKRGCSSFIMSCRTRRVVLRRLTISNSGARHTTVTKRSGASGCSCEKVQPLAQVC